MQRFEIIDSSSEESSKNEEVNTSLEQAYSRDLVIHSPQNDFLTYLESLRIFLNLSISDFYKDVGPLDLISEEKNALALVKLATYHNLDPINLWRKNIDFEAARLRIISPFPIIPPRYLHSPSINMSTFRSIILALDKYNIGEYALKKMQIERPAIWANRPISITSIIDLLNDFSIYFNDEDLTYIGKLNALTTAHYFFSEQIERVEMTTGEIIRKLFIKGKILGQLWKQNVLSESECRILFKNELNLNYCPEEYLNKIEMNYIKKLRASFIQGIFEVFGYFGVEVSEYEAFDNPYTTIISIDYSCLHHNTVNILKKCQEKFDMCAPKSLELVHG